MSEIYNILASVKKDKEGAFRILFPAIPGCFSAADTWGEIVPMATEALALYCCYVGDLSEYSYSSDKILDEIMFKGYTADVFDKNAMYILIPVMEDEFIAVKDRKKKND